MEPLAVCSAVEAIVSDVVVGLYHSLRGRVGTDLARDVGRGLAREHECLLEERTYLLQLQLFSLPDFLLDVCDLSCSQLRLVFRFSQLMPVHHLLLAEHHPSAADSFLLLFDLLNRIKPLHL